jgi:cephalosporin hydroxylase
MRSMQTPATGSTTALTCATARPPPPARRFGWTGPLPAVRRFVAEHPNFQPDRERELLFTDHSFGYLKRLS